MAYRLLNSHYGGKINNDYGGNRDGTVSNKKRQNEKQRKNDCVGWTQDKREYR